MQNISIGFIGGGNMAHAMLSGLTRQQNAAQNIWVVEPDEEKCHALESKFGINTSQEINAIESCDVIVLAVKPQQLKAVCQSIKKLSPSQLIISIAAGIRATDIARWLNNHRVVVRVMPNTPAQIQLGVSALYALEDVSQTQRNLAENIMAAVGKTLWVDDEKAMDSVTAISGSGPAYVFYLIEALQEAAVKLGLSAENARILALETFYGASKLASESEVDVQTLRAQVTSKGGTTEQGILVMESENIKEILHQTAKAAQEKSVILGDALGRDD
jgi:pyrroline-5-carboxylate reductase